ncbi:putative RNA polymerase II subunit (nucleomorph) [Guillardia theta]|uniref:Putative RNA polymerase II subunit n=1 Tax=Guillardia theta TaxID=55529 RepID=Q98SA8_GUITH|nr:putative RNA polymerase II subunit [Guillardia theta]AAK39675.1 putative RNA polymerase II subunit [Guillardia theta]|mmetsp:Transcript_20214/g.67529  ORF Transcript_20214/g.67529 Transcript_20214/m.67529 type:complete len:177 (+) Transcript_20214:11998-12528(+)
MYRQDFLILKLNKTLFIMIEICRSQFKVEHIENYSFGNDKQGNNMQNNFFKVSKIFSKEIYGQSEFFLDYNSEIYKIQNEDILDVLIIGFSNQISDFNSFELESNNENINLIKEYIREFEYVMQGMIFHTGLEKNLFFFYTSFGGLILKFYSNRNYSKDPLLMDYNIFLFIRKAKV